MKRIQSPQMIIIIFFLLTLQAFLSTIPTISLSDYDLEKAIRANNLQKVKEEISTLKKHPPIAGISRIHLRNELDHTPLGTAIFTAAELPIINYLIESEHDFPSFF